MKITLDELKKEALNYPFSQLWSRKGSDKIVLDNAIKNLVDYTKAFRRAGVTTWLMFGTLLGVYRDQDLIHHDRDVDTGIFAKDIDGANEATEILKSQGFELARTRKGLFTIIRDDEYIDIQVFYDKDDKSYVTYDAMGPERIVSKSHLCDFWDFRCFDEDLTMPGDTEGLLGAWYGDWRTPQENKYAYA